jgi:HAD superfamily hydrolase (TIGR01549 family)
MFGILFDLEGTLVDTIYYVNQEELDEERLEVKKKLIELGIPEKELDGLVRQTLLRNRAFNWIEANYDPKRLNRFRSELDSFMGEIEMTYTKRARLYPDTVQTLSRLKEERFEMGLVTNTSREPAEYLLRSFNLTPFFNAIVSGSDVSRLKPDPGMIHIAFTKMKSKIRWMVGDTIYDAEVAKNTGLKSIIIRRDGGPPSFEHDHFIQNLLEILPIVSERRGK